MPLVTPNPVIGPDWGLLVPNGAEFLLSFPFRANTNVELAPMDSETAPDESVDPVFGHSLSKEGDEGITRALVGPGYVYARTRDFSESGTEVTVSLTTWESSSSQESVSITAGESEVLVPNSAPWSLSVSPGDGGTAVAAVTLHDPDDENAVWHDLDEAALDADTLYAYPAPVAGVRITATTADAEAVVLS